MNRFVRLSLLSSLVCAASAALSQNPMDAGPPNVLVIQREYLKPGKSGSLHAKTESAFVKAMSGAKWPTYYVGMDSMSGPSRSLFLMGYDSVEAWQKDNDAMDKNATLSAAIDRASVADGELLSSYEQSVWHFRKDLSLAAPIDIATMRYFEILMFKVKPGHEMEFEEAAKMYQSAYQKISGSNWATYDNLYGADDGGVYLIFFPRKSLAEVDKGFDDDKAVMAAWGSSGQKKAAELTAASVESSQINLFHFNPKLSYVEDRWVTTDPAFWKPKPMAAPKPAAAPAQ